LFFGSGFYVLNLAELHRKQECGVLPLWPNFVKWQQMRMVELFVISVTSLYGAKLVFEHPVLSFPAGVISLLVAIWQLVITNDYRRLKFIKTGT
jgi:membrane protein YdbS with pleckstrin-like domain